MRQINVELENRAFFSENGHGSVRVLNFWMGIGGLCGGGCGPLVESLILVRLVVTERLIFLSNDVILCMCAGVVDLQSWVIFIYFILFIFLNFFFFKSPYF